MPISRSGVGAAAFLAFTLVLAPVNGAGQGAGIGENFSLAVSISGVPAKGQLHEGIASGFVVTTKTASYLVTALHALYPEEGKRWPAIRISAYVARHELEAMITLGAVAATGDIAEDADIGVAVVRIADVIQGEGPAARTAITAPRPGIEVKTSGSVLRAGAPLISLFGARIPTDITRFDDVMLGRRIVVAGYSAIGPGLPARHDRLTLRSGIVASKIMQPRRIVIDAASFDAHSGGPVIDVSDIPRVIGVLLRSSIAREVGDKRGDSGSSGRVSVNAGYSLVAPMDRVLVLIDQIEQKKR